MTANSNQKALARGKRARASLGLLIVLGLLFQSGLQARASVLEGRIESSKDGQTDGGFPEGATPITEVLGAPSSAREAAAPRVARALPSVGSGPVAPPDSFPAGFVGTWQCVTRVTSSAVETVSPGTTLASEVRFVADPGGKVKAVWVQPGWTEAQAAAVAWNDSEARVDRTCYYYGEGMNGSWASRSRDHFVRKSPDTIECDSYVDQYLDGRYLGRYRTISVLTKMSTVDTIATSEKTP
ncbi:MAG: hypothetical protein AB7W16_10010 [Candidatus Obscuribacterales bacterium]